MGVWSPLRVVRQGGKLPEQVQRRAAGGLSEQGRRPLVAQPGPPGRVKVGRRQLPAGPSAR
jgi:hypothetical protein